MKPLLLVILHLFLLHFGVGLLENGGFPCKIRDSMKLDRRFHGKPQTTRPPVEFTVVGEDGQPVQEYKLGKMYRVRLVGYVHFRGVLLEPRLSTSAGHLIGGLRGGRFISEEAWDEYGVDYQECGYYKLQDTVTHKNDDKKFLVEANWTTEVDVGAVQFMVTVASDDSLYWERWRPRSAFIRPERYRGLFLNDTLFSEENFVEKQVSPAEEKEALANMGGLPFNKTVLPEMEQIPASFSSAPNAVSPEEEKLESLSAEPMVQLEKAGSFQPNEEEKNEDLAIAEVTERTFKRFQPQAELTSDDLKFLNSHTMIQKDFVDEKMDPEEICRQANPCANEGNCVVNKEKYSCECREGWTGTNCTEKDWCISHNCDNGASCENNEKATGYVCKCQEGFVGNFCQFECLKDQCQNNGTCVIKRNGKLGCECPPGWAGAKCEREFNECSWKKCKNGAKCTDLFNDYACNCTKGWMGRNCDRPCQDVYKSCNLWKREGQCDLLHQGTNFFEYNCAASCGKCEKDEKTIKTVKPIAPILMPFFWLLGEWTSHSKGFRNKTMDYPFDMQNCQSYNETITFTVAEVLVFGTPSLNFTSKAVCDSDSSNVHESRGFLTIRQYNPAGENVMKASLSTVDNHGVTMIEEGELHAVHASMGNFVNLSPNYKIILGDTKQKLADELHRQFTRKGQRLMQLFSKTTNGRTMKFSKTYTLTKSYDYL